MELTEDIKRELSLSFRNRIIPEFSEIINNGHWMNTVFKADEIYKNHQPYTDFLTFCILNGMIMKMKEDEYDPNEEEVFVLKVDVMLLLSENETVNQEVIKMLDKFDVYYNKMTCEIYNEFFKR